MSFDPNSYVAVFIEAELYMEIQKRHPNQASAIVSYATSDYLERTDPNFAPYKQDEDVGIYWESLFLPVGTQIRTKYFGEHKVANIEGESIVWEDKTYPSIAQLANSMRGNTSNNAWTVLEIKRPTDKSWTLAQALRRSK